MVETMISCMITHKRYEYRGMHSRGVTVGTNCLVCPVGWLGVLKPLV